MPSLVSFYNKNSCIPVNQQGTEFERSNARRYLYNSLGLNSLAFKNISVCEIGPGSGQNAVDLSKRGISSIMLIEPTREGQKKCQDLIDQGEFQCSVNIYPSTVENYVDTSSESVGYDLVITEGLVGSSGYKKPIELFYSIASLVEKDGFLMVGCEDNVGWFAEMTRRLVYLIFCKLNNIDLRDGIDKSLELLEKHVPSSHESLDFKTRRVSKDIIIDNILSPVLDNPFFGPLEIIENIQSFDLISTSPDYSIIPSYYKEAGGDDQFYARKFVNEYVRRAFSVFDYSIKDSNFLDLETGYTFISLIDKCMADTKNLSRNLLSSSDTDISDFLVKYTSSLREVSNFLEVHGNHRSVTLSFVIDLFDQLILSFHSSQSFEFAKRLLSFNDFNCWFGRTQTTLLLEKKK